MPKIPRSVLAAPVSSVSLTAVAGSEINIIFFGGWALSEVVNQVDIRYDASLSPHFAPQIA